MQSTDRNISERDQSLTSLGESDNERMRDVLRSRNVRKTQKYADERTNERTDMVLRMASRNPVENKTLQACTMLTPSVNQPH